MAMEIEGAVVDTLAFTPKGGGLSQPSYIAVRAYVYERSQDGEALKYIESGKPEHVKVGDRDVWQSFVVLENQKTGHQSTGRGEHPIDGGPYGAPEFAANMAHSKAVRNAMKGQVNEIKMRVWVTEQVKKRGGKGVQEVDTRPVPDRADEAAIAAARKAMGHPEGGPGNGKSESPPAAGASSAIQQPAAGDDKPADPQAPEAYEVDKYEWGVGGDKGSIPTLPQAQWFSSPARKSRRMTRAEIQGKTRKELIDLRDKWGEDQ